MIKIPVRFPSDPYCRAMSRLMLTADGETGELYIGVTPDGVSFGRDMLSRLSAWSGDRKLDYTCEIRDNAVVLTTECGYARFAIAQPNKLVIEGKGISLMIGNGKTAGIFMGGGSAVDDAAEGALYVTSGVRLRVVPRGGSAEVRSAWDLDALSDPDPRVFIHPAEDGALGGVVFETDFDVPFSDDGVTVDEAAADMATEFEAFMNKLARAPENDEAVHAAYIVWTTLQPARVFDQQCITAPEYVSSRRKCGTAMLADNVLLAAFLKDPAEAAERMCSFLKYRQPDGLVPRQANNRMFLWEAEAPLYGVVFKARPDICGALPEEDYKALAEALAWWMKERFCPERKLFYYLHRYEPGCGKKLPFAGTAPEFAPELNVYMALWLEGMSAAAEKLGRKDDAARFGAAAGEVRNSLASRLRDGDGFRFLDITDSPVCEGHPAAAAAAALEGLAAPEGNLPTAYALPVLLAAPSGQSRELARSIAAEGREVTTLTQALTVLAAVDTAEGGV